MFYLMVSRIKRNHFSCHWSLYLQELSASSCHKVLSWIVNWYWCCPLHMSNTLHKLETGSIKKLISDSRLWSMPHPSTSSMPHGASSAIAKTLQIIIMKLFSSTLHKMSSSCLCLKLYKIFVFIPLFIIILRQRKWLCFVFRWKDNTDKGWFLSWK